MIFQFKRALVGFAIRKMEECAVLCRITHICRIRSRAVMVEQIKYDVVRKIGKTEIRHYPAVIITRVEGYGDDGFDLLFKFITGHNRQSAKVQMTAPVISERIEMTAPVLSDQRSIAFVMPANLRVETTPVPIDDRVKIVEIPERYVAALQFSGRWSNSIFNEKPRQLLQELAKTGIETSGNVFAMRYNSPFTPWFMRRNEVAVEVKVTE